MGLNGEKNRNDHRHHAVDACVIGVTDQGLLQRFAQASASAREKQLNRLVENMPYPWGTDQGHEYYDSVKRAIECIWVSHKPDHGHEGAMHEDTTYRPPHLDRKNMWRTRGIGGNKPNEKKADSEAMVTITAPWLDRHARDAQGVAQPYKGYVGGSNYCIEIVRNDKGKWEGEIISTFEAYQLVRKHGQQKLRTSHQSMSGKPLLMRVFKGDMLRLEIDGEKRLLQVTSVKKQLELYDHLDASADSKPITKYAGSLQSAKARRVTISPIGELHDPGFKE